MAVEAPAPRGPVLSAFAELGALMGFTGQIGAAAIDAVRHGRFAWQECVDQTWFLASVTLWPALLVTIPLGVVVSVDTASMAGQLGAQGYGGAVAALVIVGQAAPLVCALLMSGIGGSAVCSDLGARSVREEIDALEVLSIPVVERLILPRVVAAVVVTLALDAMVMVVGIAASFGFQVLLLHASPGSFLDTLAGFSRLSDFVVAELKAGVFGMIAVVVSGYKGLIVRGGAGEVGRAVNEAVVLAFIMVFLANVVITELYPLVVPAKGSF